MYVFGQGVHTCLKLSMTLEVSGRVSVSLCCPLRSTPAEFISHCFLCTGIYDVTANISFVLRWRISQGSCPYGVKQTANMDMLWLRSQGWVDIMVAEREPNWNTRIDFTFTVKNRRGNISYCNTNTLKSKALILSPLSTPITIPSLSTFPFQSNTLHHIKMKTKTFPGSESLRGRFITNDEKDIQERHTESSLRRPWWTKPQRL